MAKVSFVGGVAALMLCSFIGAEEAKKAPEHLPVKLRWQNSKFRGNYSTLRWDGEVLVYEHALEGREQPARKIEPSVATWKKFWQEVDAAAVWKWKGNYVDKTIADGHSWSLTIERGDKKVESIGSNMYPAEFARFEKAIRVLKGEKAE